MLPSIAVAGAGPAGLMVALLLSRQGLSVDGASQLRVDCSISACL
jgi:predicted NAD/FAD-dependent oxidoreductase